MHSFSAIPRNTWHISNRIEAQFAIFPTAVLNPIRNPQLHCVPDPIRLQTAQASGLLHKLARLNFTSAM